VYLRGKNQKKNFFLEFFISAFFCFLEKIGPPLKVAHFCPKLPKPIKTHKELPKWLKYYSPAIFEWF